MEQQTIKHQGNQQSPGREIRAEVSNSDIESNPSVTRIGRSSERPHRILRIVRMLRMPPIGCLYRMYRILRMNRILRMLRMIGYTPLG